jgi:hypothetical protein
LGNSEPCNPHIELTSVSVDAEAHPRDCDLKPTGRSVESFLKVWRQQVEIDRPLREPPQTGPSY